jgi:hypothetical protein
VSFADITDKKAVVAAIHEFDKLGRQTFLQKYGFGPARSYYLLYRGGRYDSKAIIGAAHAYQYPDIGPLTAHDFSGGEKTVATKLRSLGFEVSHSGFEKRAPMAWAFCANPKRYRIREAVRHLEIDYWTIGDSDVRAGDCAIIWQTLDSDGNRGIVAFAEVLGDPEPRTDEANPYWVKPEGGLEQSRVPVSYSVPEDLPWWVDDTESGSLLNNLSVAKARGGTVFKVTQEQWLNLTSMVPYSEISVAELESREQLRYRSSTGSRQGFGLNSAERKTVEEYAMRFAATHFKREWYSVEDVSATSSYDLLCRRGTEELRVEVKGTSTAGHQIILTRNEVFEGQQPGYALFVVSEVVIDRSEPRKPVAIGGKAHLFSPWQPNLIELQPISYLCDIDFGKGIIVNRIGSDDADDQ